MKAESSSASSGQIQSQYVLKFCGAAISSTTLVLLLGTVYLWLVLDMTASGISNPFDVYVVVNSHLFITNLHVDLGSRYYIVLSRFFGRINTISRSDSNYYAKVRPGLPPASVVALTIHFVAPGAQQNAFWRLGVRMAQTEGFQSLLTGLTASMMREIVYSGIRLGTYEYFKDSSVSDIHQSHSCSYTMLQTLWPIWRGSHVWRVKSESDGCHNSGNCWSVSACVASFYTSCTDAITFQGNREPDRPD